MLHPRGYVIADLIVRRHIPGGVRQICGFAERAWLSFEVDRFRSVHCGWYAEGVVHYSPGLARCAPTLGENRKNLLPQRGCALVAAT